MRKIVASEFVSLDGVLEEGGVIDGRFGDSAVPKEAVWGSY
ncbi:MAG TPA: hypothetical protein VN178_08985 [Rubrobacter sp.]|jgi:hypothetical protein|nr:hypothetical protein [Rubrobacter sp.]